MSCNWCTPWHEIQKKYLNLRNINYLQKAKCPIHDIQAQENELGERIQYTKSIEAIPTDEVISPYNNEIFSTCKVRTTLV